MLRTKLLTCIVVLIALLAGCSPASNTPLDSDDLQTNTPVASSPSETAAPTEPLATETPLAKATPAFQIISPENAASLVEIASLTGHGCSVFSVSFSADSQRLASTSCDGSLRVWDLASGVGTILAQPGAMFGSAFSPDGSKLAAWFPYDTKLPVYDVLTGSELTVLNGSAAQFDAAFSPDGTVLSSLVGGTVGRWQVGTWSPLATLGADLGPAMAFSPDGSLLASREADGPIRIWDVAGGNVVSSIQVADVFSAFFSDDATKLVVITNRFYNYMSDSEYIVKVYDVATGSRLNNFGGDPDKGHGAALSPDGSLLAIALGTYECPPCDPAPDGAVAVFNVASGRELLRLTGHTDLVQAVAFSPDGRYIASGGSAGDMTIKIWAVRP